IKAHPIVHRPGEAPGAVRYLGRAWDGLVLWGADSSQVLYVVYKVLHLSSFRPAIGQSLLRNKENRTAILFVSCVIWRSKGVLGKGGIVPAGGVPVPPGAFRRMVEDN